MNWGIGMALGQALQRAGNTWGEERIDLRRQMEEDSRRKAAHELAMKTGQQGLEAGALAMDRDRQALETARTIDPLRVQQIEQEIQTGKLSQDQARLQLSEIQKKVTAQDAIPDFYSSQAQSAVDLAKLAPQATRANIAQSNAGVAASQNSIAMSQAANARAEADAARDAEIFKATAGQRTPWYLAENDPSIKTGIADFRKRVAAQDQGFLRILQGQLGRPQLPGMEQNPLLQDPNFMAMRRNLEQMAEQIAIGIVDQYEANHARQQGGPAWANPQDREGAIKKLKEKYFQSLVNGESGQPGTVPAPGVGAGAEQGFI